MIDKEKIIEILREHPEVIISALERAGYKVARLKDLKILYKKLSLEITKTNERITKLELEVAQTNERIAKIELEITKINGEIIQINERITKVELEVAKTNERVAKIELEIAKMHERISEIEAKLLKMESRLLRFFISAIFIQFFFIALTYFGTIFIIIQILKK